MLIHKLQCRVKLNKIGKRDNKKSLKKHDSGTEINSVRVIVTYAVNAFVSPVTRSEQIKKFGQMQALTNDNYSEIKLYSIFHIEYKVIEFSTNKKEPTITFPIPILERQRGSH